MRSRLLVLLVLLALPLFLGTSPATRPSTSPATQPSTSPATRPSTSPATRPSTSPATRPGAPAPPRGAARGRAEALRDLTAGKAAILSYGIVVPPGVDPETGLRFRGLGCVADRGVQEYVTAYNDTVRDWVRKNGPPANSYKPALLTCERMRDLSRGEGAVRLGPDHPGPVHCGDRLVEWRPAEGMVAEGPATGGGMRPIAGLNAPEGVRLAEVPGAPLWVLDAGETRLLYDPRSRFTVQTLRCPGPAGPETKGEER